MSQQDLTPPLEPEFDAQRTIDAVDNGELNRYTIDWEKMARILLAKTTPPATLAELLRDVLSDLSSFNTEHPGYLEHTADKLDDAIALVAELKEARDVS